MYLFAYGTLIPELAPAFMRLVLKSFVPKAKGKVKGKLYDLGEFPGAVLDSRSRTSIRGQIFEIPDDPIVLAKLDDYEEFDPSNPDTSLFVRRKRMVQSEDGNRYSCWIYEYNRPIVKRKLVPRGVYPSPSAKARVRFRG
jgi:gamma-glutamylcyclotransferase (GGCT)/AIG2-like uncharacterized protein YtfP